MCAHGDFQVKILGELLFVMIKTFLIFITSFQHRVEIYQELVTLSNEKKGSITFENIQCSYLVEH